MYVAFGSHGDHGTYQGWLMGYDPATLAQKFVWSSTDPTSGNNQGAIWQSGGGPAADSSGNIYLETANGDFNVDSGGVNYSDSVVGLTAGGSVIDYFTASKRVRPQSLRRRPGFVDRHRSSGFRGYSRPSPSVARNRQARCALSAQ